MIRWHRVVTALLIGGALSCGEALPPAPPPATPLEVGESRSIELRYLRFDVANYEETLTREDLLALPEETRQRLWLLDLDLTNGPNSPRLLENALRAIKQLPASQLEPAAANMQGLLLMTPDTAALEGTALEELTALSPLVGIPSERVVAQMLGVGVTEPILSEPVVTATILDQVIATHPNALTRLGPRTPDNPEGVYPVAPGTLPITLEDVASDFATLSQKFGPVQTAQGSHPGFIVGATRAKVFEDDFSLTVRANANALPYKGVDLTDGSGASVNSLRAQIEELFDFDDPDWLQIEGLVIGEPVIEEMTFQIVEEETLVTGGRSPVPQGRGDSRVWELPPWTFERVVAGAAQRAFGARSAEVRYGTAAGGAVPLIEAIVEAGWQEIDVIADLGSPPAPSYLWDILLEVAQVRLHDGGLPEGEATVAFTLEDVPTGIDTTTIEATIQDNLEANPRALSSVATELIDTTRGAADFYYVRVDEEAPLDEQGDWLFFVAEQDLPPDDGRQWSDYERVGFFKDSDLTQKISTTDAIAGDRDHEKVHIMEGDQFYAADDTGAVFKVTAGPKPSRATRQLEITRIR